MGMPHWWEARRYGLFVHASLASVPAWAPIGQDASWYRWHLGEKSSGGPLQPMAEVVAHHRDRWGHIERFDDFVDLLTFDRFDAEAWARLAVDAGAGTAVIVAEHHDGLCWWDAPSAPLRTVDRGPQRNVVAEFAAACERNGLVLGTHVSTAADDSDANRRALDLVERYGARVIRSDRRHLQESGPAPDRAHLDRLWATDPELVINDEWGGPGHAGSSRTVRTVHDVPATITREPWELCRSVGRGFGHNRTERAEHTMSATDIVALLTEVVAKGGHLLLSVGARADGSIPDANAEPLRAAGSWVRAHRELVDRSSPWTTWGDDGVRYVCVDGAVHAIDVAGAGRFAALSTDAHRVVGVHRIGAGVGADGAQEVRFAQDQSGLQLDVLRPTPWRRPVSPGRDDPGDPVVVDVAVYRIDLGATDRPVELFDPVEQDPIALAPLLAGASPGEIVQLGDGTYHGPADVPAGVILRGLGPARTRIDGSDGRALQLLRNSRAEHLTVMGGEAALEPADPATPVIEIVGQFATLLGCRVSGTVRVAADDVLLRASALTTVRAEQADRSTVSRCVLSGRSGDVGIHVVGGTGHEIDSCELHGHRCAIRVTDSTGAVVRGNDVEARWWGVHLERTEGAHVHGNRVRNTMRGFDVDGGTGALVEGNAVTDGDSGCIVERGAAESQVAGNHWERCRIGVLAWDATGLHAHDNHALALHEPDAAVVIGP